MQLTLNRKELLRPDAASLNNPQLIQLDYNYMTKIHHKTLLSAFISIATALGVVYPASAQLGIGGTTSNTTGITGILSGSNSGSGLISGTLGTVTNSQTAVTGAILNSPTSILQNTAQITSGATLTDSLNATLQETTNTAVGTIAGASTDSQTTATIVNPTQIVPALTSTLNDPSSLIQPDGQLNIGVTINDQGVKADVNTNLNLGIGDLANVNICLDGSASVGSPDDGSLANCPQKPQKPKEVPEPAFIGGLVLLGAYLTVGKKKISSLVNLAKI
jgi:hypothetical protein